MWKLIAAQQLWRVMTASKHAQDVLDLDVAAKPSAGSRLVEDLTHDDDPYRITIMIVEAGRVADRLERFAALESGDRAAWAHVRVNRDQVLELQVDKALQESRMQAGVLRQLLAEIHRQRAGIPMGPDDDDVLSGV